MHIMVTNDDGGYRPRDLFFSEAKERFGLPERADDLARDYALTAHDDYQRDPMLIEKLKSFIDDGRRWLHRHPIDQFDVIVMNTTWHWRAHITNLLSTEFMQLARAHLLPGGLFYFNTTSSDDVKKTAVTVFPHAMRVYNFMAVSDAPLVFDKDRWRKTLVEFSFEGRPAIDRSNDDGQRFFDDLVLYADTIDGAPVDDGLESRASVMARTASARVVTDDNMVPEWREVLRFQEPP